MRPVGPRLRVVHQVRQFREWQMQSFLTETGSAIVMAISLLRLSASASAPGTPAPFHRIPIPSFLQALPPCRVALLLVEPPTSRSVAPSLYRALHLHPLPVFLSSGTMPLLRAELSCTIMEP